MFQAAVKLMARAAQKGALRPNLGGPEMLQEVPGPSWVGARSWDTTSPLANACTEVTLTILNCRGETAQG